MFPNTFTMQEYIRRYFDEFLDRLEGGEEVEKPRIYTIPKGTLATGRLLYDADMVPRNADPESTYSDQRVLLSFLSTTILRHGTSRFETLPNRRW